MNQTKFEKLTYLNLLLDIDGIGPQKILNLIARFKSVEKIVYSNFNELIKVPGVSEILAKKILRAGNNLENIKTKLEKDTRILEKLGAQIITFWDSDYPALLKNIYSPPIILYILGNIIEKDNNSIGVVGTRRPSNYGKWAAEKITGELVNQNITIVSGLARGIDSIAHRTALKAGGRTIAVIGSGLDVIYPPENKKLFYEIAENGAVVSEYKLGTKPDAQNFPKRNRIISGLSLGTVVVETRKNGGALQTAAFALDQNREVFAVPGNINIQQSEGTNTIIKRGEAKLITSASDILDELSIKLNPSANNKNKPNVEVNLFEQKILDTLSYNPVHIDKIAASSNLNTSECLVYLLSLEFKGLIKQLPGKNFILN